MTPEIYAGLYTHMASGYLDNLPPKKQPIPHDKIIATVCEYFNVEASDLKTSSRKRTRTEPRQVAMYFLSKETDWCLKKIGKMFNRDHSTVIYGRDTVNDLIDTNKAFKAKINDIAELLKN